MGLYSLLSGEVGVRSRGTQGTRSQEAGQGSRGGGSYFEIWRKK